MIQKENLLTPRQAAEILGISPRTIYQWAWLRKNLIFVKIGGSLRISGKDLMDFIEQRRREPEE